MNSAEFRKQLIKIMPGYTWTIHRSDNRNGYLSATGIQSAGFNRLSTLSVDRWRNDRGEVEYEVKSSGFGRRAPWLSINKGSTLAQALRSLQDHYEARASMYSNHAASLRGARKKCCQGLKDL